MTTRKTRSDIETEIATLQAELAAVQPEKLVVYAQHISRPDTRLREIEFSNTYGEPGICVTRTDRDKPVYAGALFSPADVPAIVAWLNYHFPPEAA